MMRRSSRSSIRRTSSNSIDSMTMESGKMVMPISSTSTHTTSSNGNNTNRTISPFKKLSNRRNMGKQAPAQQQQQQHQTTNDDIMMNDFEASFVFDGSATINTSVSHTSMPGDGYASSSNINRNASNSSNRRGSFNHSTHSSQHQPRSNLPQQVRRGGGGLESSLRGSIHSNYSNGSEPQNSQPNRRMSGGVPYGMSHAQMKELHELYDHASPKKQPKQIQQQQQHNHQYQGQQLTQQSHAKAEARFRRDSLESFANQSLGSFDSSTGDYFDDQNYQQQYYPQHQQQYYAQHQQQQPSQKQLHQQQIMNRLEQIKNNGSVKVTPFRRELIKTPSVREFLQQKNKEDEKFAAKASTFNTTSNTSNVMSNSTMLKNQLYAKLQPISEASSNDESNEDARAMLKPFISYIVIQSIVQKNHHHYYFENSSNGSNSGDNQKKNPFRSSMSHYNELNNRNDSDKNGNSIVSFRPYTCQAAVLFVDLCGYSKITAAIAHHGAHYISDTVNAYLSRLLTIIDEFGGDVIKFAGDAIMIIWYGNELSLEVNVLCAAICATELQARAGEHAIGVDQDGNELSFKIHCGLGCGPLDSEIFEAPVNNNMQRLYHYVGGEALLEIGDLVDLAKPGEICVSQNCFNFIENGGTYAEIEGPLGAKILLSLDIDDPGLFEFVYWHIRDMKIDRKKSRENVNIEEEFIHDNVLAYLRHHNGFAPTQIAQMRSLCVLFIAMTSNGSSVNWLMEVQAILDNKRCPIVQIILDDKGVHIVAAVNLYEAIPDASLVGLEVCQELIKKRVGAAVGCASGQTFCGVTGSTTACRWDITGPAVVRAARLMQYALKNHVHFAIDGSLYENPMAATRMKVLDQSVRMKGTSDPIVVYTLSDASSFSAFRILESVHGSVHNNEVQKIQNHIDSRERSAVIVTGIPLAGMIIACQRAAGYCDFVPYLHLCETSVGFLQLARTIATWFQYVNDTEIKQLSQSVIADMTLGCWSCAHDQCVQLVNVAIDKGYNACFVVDRIQYLDKFSLSLIRECLQRPRRPSKNDFQFIGMESSDVLDDQRGHICFLCTHLALYNSKSAEDLVEDILRSNQSHNIPIVSLGESTKEELRMMTREMVDMEVEDRWLDAYAEASGYCAEYFLERVEAVRKICATQWKATSKHQQAYFEISDSLAFHIPPRFVRKNNQLKVTTICPELAMVFSNIYDDFPPVCQMIIKVITIATRSRLNRLSYDVLYDAMNDLLDHGVGKESFEMLLKEMNGMHIVKIIDRDDNDRSDGGGTASNCKTSANGAGQRLVYMQSPALADITMDVCTPVQVRSIAQMLINRIEKSPNSTFHRSFTLASLYCLLDEMSTVQRWWKEGYRDFIEASQDWTERCKNQWRELIDDEIRDAGYDTHDILGRKYYIPDLHQHTISSSIALLQFYTAPIALGPMSQSLAILCRNTFYESGLFAKTKGKLTNIHDADTIRSNANTTSGRYMMQLSVIENYLRDVGFGAPYDEVQSEMEMISFIANPSDSAEGVATKAVLLLEEIVPRFIEHRLQRLYKSVRQLKDTYREEGGTIPEVFDNANIALRLAYDALQIPDKNWMDAAQDALMILATMNWKPKHTIREYIPIQQQHTVAYIRDVTLKRLNYCCSSIIDDEDNHQFDTNKHRQNVDDLEAFLIVSALLENATDNGFC